MAVTAYETLVVGSEFVTAYRLVWNRYRRPAPGILEHLLDVNPHLARIHREGLFLPVGTQVLMPIDREIMDGTPEIVRAVTLYGTR